MAKREKNIIYKRLVRAYLSSIISISLVLLLIGIFGVLAINAKNVSDYFKENVWITAILNSEVGENDAKILEGKLKNIQAVKETAYISKDQGTAEMKKLLGEDFLAAFESNPIPVSIDLKVNAEYFNPDSLKLLKSNLEKLPQIEEVSYQESLLEVLNNNMEKIGIFFVVFIVLLMFISFVLINNTVRLNVYSKRFSIYTMRLVGAKRSYIRAPYLVKAVFQGLLSGLLASLALVGLLYMIKNEFGQLFVIFDLKLIAIVLGGVVILGALICVVCTFFVVNRLVSFNNSDLYY
jgi:Cell division protein